jgi:hypothetical protein
MPQMSFVSNPVSVEILTCGLAENEKHIINKTVSLFIYLIFEIIEKYSLSKFDISKLHSSFAKKLSLNLVEYVTLKKTNNFLSGELLLRFMMNGSTVTEKPREYHDCETFRKLLVSTFISHRQSGFQNIYDNPYNLNDKFSQIDDICSQIEGEIDINLLYFYMVELVFPSWSVQEILMTTIVNLPNMVFTTMLPYISSDFNLTSNFHIDRDKNSNMKVALSSLCENIIDNLTRKNLIIFPVYIFNSWHMILVRNPSNLFTLI